METFVMVHPSLPECIGDEPTLAAWAPHGWIRKDDAKAEEPEHEEPHATTPKHAKGKK